MNQKIQKVHNHFQKGLENLQNIIERINNKKTYQKMIRQANRIYELKIFRVLNMTPVKARKIYNVLIQKYQSNLGQKNAWLQNQKKLFIFIVLCQCFIQSKYIHQLNFEDYSILKSIFNNKNQQFLKFESYGIIKKRQKQHKWSEQQDNLLLNIIKQNKQFQNHQKDWNQISKELFNQSQQKFYRPGRHIRERWMNHLDPNKIKGIWTVEQDLTLLKYVLKNGKKWSQISKVLSDLKSEHMIKNRFNSLIHKATRQLNITSQNKLIKKLILSLESQRPEQQFNLKQDFKTSTKTSTYENNNELQKIQDQKQQVQLYLQNLNNKNNFKDKKNQRSQNLLKAKRHSSIISQKQSFIQLNSQINYNEYEQICSQQQQQQKQHQSFKQPNATPHTPLFTPFSLIDKKQPSYHIQSPIFSTIANNNTFTPSIFFIEQTHKEKGIFRAMEESFYLRANSSEYNHNFNGSFQKFMNQNQKE